MKQTVLIMVMFGCLLASISTRLQVQAAPDGRLDGGNLFDLNLGGVPAVGVVVDDVVDDVGEIIDSLLGGLGGVSFS